MNRSHWRAALAALLLLAPLAASALTDAYVAVTVNLRAGPDDDYPRIGYVSAGSYVDIQGCLDDWSWCDVSVYGERGWIAARYLQFAEGNELVYVPEHGPRLGLPIVSFILGAYWDQHYRDRHWYRERDRWIGSSHGHRPPYRGYDHYIGPRAHARQNVPLPPNLPVRPREPRPHVQPRPHDQGQSRPHDQRPQQFGRIQTPPQQPPQQRPRDPRRHSDQPGDHRTRDRDRQDQ